MTVKFNAHVQGILQEIKSEGLYKGERCITSPQSGRINVARSDDGPGRLINLCANNYLGLADHPDLVHAAKSALDSHGHGMASVRFICGTQDIHLVLEQKLATFLQKDDAILFAACFDANGGLFEPLLGVQDAIVSDSLNHASIIDGIRLCKAQRYRYANSNMVDLETQLKAAKNAGARFIMIATDGVFSMDGYLAKLPQIKTLADKYGAVLMVDDCHSTGFIGPQGRGTAAHFGVDVDIITGTLGKSLGGAVGGYIAGSKPVIELLRQRARPYLFSNSLPPSVVASGIAALDIVGAGDDLRAQLFENSTYWRAGLSKLGFKLLDGEHPIIPVMLGDANIAQQMTQHLYDNGVYVAGFFFPVVPKGRARIRTQMSSALTREDLDFALDAFARAGRDLGIIS